MNRLARFQNFRFIGTRDTMRVYDCDDETQFEELQRRVDEEHLVDRKQMQAFAPDTVDEARNRGFHPIQNPRTQAS